MCNDTVSIYRYTVDLQYVSIHPSIHKSKVLQLIEGFLSSTVETERCDIPVIRAHLPALLFKNGSDHPGLPFHRYCLRPPRNNEEAYQ